MLFINGESAATLPHLARWSGSFSWDAFCLVLPMHPSQLRGASLTLHGKVLGSIRFTWLKTQAGQRRVRLDNTAYLSSRPPLLKLQEHLDSVYTLQTTTALLRASGRAQLLLLQVSLPLDGGEGCRVSSPLLKHRPSRRCIPGVPTHSSSLNHSCLR